MSEPSTLFNRQVFPINAFLVSRFAERFAYYGFRSIVFVYLLTADFGFNQEQIQYYNSAFLIALSLLALPGGLISDLFLGARRAIIIGSLLQSVGYFLMCISNKTVFMAGLLIYLCGSGIYSPSIYGLLGIASRRENKSTISYILILSVAGSLAGLCAPFLFGSFNENFYRFSFALAGLMAFVPALIFYKSKNTWFDKLNTNEPSTNQNLNWKNLFLMLAFIFLSVLFSYFLYQGSQKAISTPALYSGFISVSKYFYLVQTFSYLLITCFFVVLWQFLKVSYYLKLALGFIIYAFVIYGFNGLQILIPGQITMLTGVVLFFLEIICELLVLPTIISLILEKAPLNFTSTFIGLCFSLNSLVNYFYSYIDEVTQNFSFLNPVVLFTLVSLLFGTVMLVIYFYNKNRQLHRSN